MRKIRISRNRNSRLEERFFVEKARRNPEIQTNKKYVKRREIRKN